MASLVGVAMPRGAPPDLATWKLMTWWRAYAGRPLADHVWPSRIERGVLTLAADSSAWASEIAFMRETLVKKLAEELPALKVRSVRTMVSLARDRPAIADDPPPAPSSRKMRVPSAEGLPRELAVALSRVENDALRTVIARAARISLATYPNEQPRDRKPSAEPNPGASDQGARDQGANTERDQGAGADGSRSASSPQSSSLSPCPDDSSSDG